MVVFSASCCATPNPTLKSHGRRQQMRAPTSGSGWLEASETDERLEFRDGAERCPRHQPLSGSARRGLEGHPRSQCLLQSSDNPRPSMRFRFAWQVLSWASSDHLKGDASPAAATQPITPETSDALGMLGLLDRTLEDS